MDNSLDTAIEKIKLQEQDKEEKLKEKREYELSIATLQRHIRDITAHNTKLQEGEKAILIKIQGLETQLEIDKIKKKALETKVIELKETFNLLKKEMNHKLSNIWELRSSFCEAIHKTSDDYDVRALLMRPVRVEPRPKKIKSTKIEFGNDDRFKAAIERREKAIAERDRLLAEPDNGEEYVRLKNALRYRLEKVKLARNQNN